MDRNHDSGGPDDNMDGFLYISWHGVHDGGTGNDKEIGAMIEIVSKVGGGQFDLYFCSTKCLRSYLNYCVDELERKLSVERSKSNEVPKRVVAKKRRAT